MTVATTVVIPTTTDNVILKVQSREVRLTNLRKMFWPERSITKGNLLQYYADVADVLLPHIRDRAMVMRRYPNGAAGSQFFMKEAPTPRPVWIRTCPISHNDDKVGSWISAAPTPLATSAMTEARAVLEKRGTQTTSPAMRCAAGKLRQSTSRPMSPPTHTEPAAR